MPFALLIIGVVLLIAGVRNTQDTLFTLVRGDFSGSGNFIFWLAAILIIGAVGYIPKLKPISTAFLALVVVVLFLKKGNASGIGGGFFSQFTSALGTTAAFVPSGTSATPALNSLASQQATTQSLLGKLAQNLSTSESISGLGLNDGLGITN